jgi:predicted negative regulator of RcsB-dependent stress response
MLYALGGIAESAAQFARAADYYLRSALAQGTRAPDAMALQARLAAAANLARAGFREDARAQFQWVIGNSKDAAQIEIARRELSRL